MNLFEGGIHDSIMNDKNEKLQHSGLLFYFPVGRFRLYIIRLCQCYNERGEYVINEPEDFFYEAV